MTRRYQEPEAIKWTTNLNLNLNGSVAPKWDLAQIKTYQDFGQPNLNISISFSSFFFFWRKKWKLFDVVATFISFSIRYDSDFFFFIKSSPIKTSSLHITTNKNSNDDAKTTYFRVMKIIPAHIFVTLHLHFLFTYFIQILSTADLPFFS